VFSGGTGGTSKCLCSGKACLRRVCHLVIPVTLSAPGHGSGQMGSTGTAWGWTWLQRESPLRRLGLRVLLFNNNPRPTDVGWTRDRMVCEAGSGVGVQQRSKYFYN